MQTEIFWRYRSRSGDQSIDCDSFRTRDTHEIIILPVCVFWLAISVRGATCVVRQTLSCVRGGVALGICYNLCILSAQLPSTCRPKYENLAGPWRHGRIGSGQLCVCPYMNCRKTTNVLTMAFLCLVYRNGQANDGQQFHPNCTVDGVWLEVVCNKCRKRSISITLLQIVFASRFAWLCQLVYWNDVGPQATKHYSTHVIQALKNACHHPE